MATRSLHKGSSRSRIFTPAPAGIPEKSDAPFWRGERCEHHVAARHAAETERRERKAAEKEAKRGTPRGERRQRSPNAQLRRLERALGRRKTLAAQQRIQQQIKQLREQLSA
jgi:hypothetical protein